MAIEDVRIKQAEPFTIQIRTPEGRTVLTFEFKDDVLCAAYDQADLDQAATQFLDYLEQLSQRRAAS